jgi:16S rRNA (guanine(966)-N(2))-methyltransferase RsmD
MRIIAGSAKRRVLKSPAFSLGVRPILARIKKSLFDILRPRLEGCAFLDMFAGSGAVGIEALSRGAAQATFVDNNPNCLSIIRQNLSRLQMFDRARLVRADATKNLTMLGGPFDLIFMGPPYHDADRHPLALTQPTLEAIARSQVLAPGGWVVAQHHAKEPPVRSPRWQMFRQERYGDSRLSFFKLVQRSTSNVQGPQGPMQRGYLTSDVGQETLD